MIKSLNDFTKSATLISRPPHTNANANDNPGLRISTHPNFRGNSKKKRGQSWDTSIRCHGNRSQGFMYRRQLLLASTSLPLKPQKMLAAMPTTPSLADYHKLANAVHEANKFKNSQHGRPEMNDVVCWHNWPEPVKPPNSSSQDQYSAIGATPPGQELVRRGINENVVTARVRRPESSKLRLQDKEEQLVLEGIEVTDDKPLCFDVYIRLEQDGDDKEEEEYVGSFSHMPPRRKQLRLHNNKAAFDEHHERKRTVRRCCLRLGINGMLNDPPLLNSHQAQSVFVKLVPTFKVDEDPIKVESICIDYT